MIYFVHDSIAHITLEFINTGVMIGSRALSSLPFAADHMVTVGRMNW